MHKLNNISKVKDCYGCGVCASACPQGIIAIKENKKGFLQPTIIEDDKCTQCGLCLNVCAFSNKLEFNSTSISTYSGYSTCPKIRYSASSGGVAFELAKHSLSLGWKVCGVQYNNERQRAIHNIFDDSKNLLETLGSKYIPSITIPAFQNLFSKVNKDQCYIVFGTPCQIASLRLLSKKFRKEENFIFVDFFCHGVPSLKVWDRYIKEKKIESKEFGSIKWRDKKNGWHDSWYIVTYDKTGRETYRSKNVEEDEFYQFFLGHYALAPCCLNSCKFKKYNSFADIRIGDLWGKKYIHEEKGVNGIICFSEKGEILLKSLSTINLTPEIRETVTEGQMEKNAVKPANYTLTKAIFNYTRISLASILRITNRISFLASIPGIIKHKIKSHLRK